MDTTSTTGALETIQLMAVERVREGDIASCGFSQFHRVLLARPAPGRSRNMSPDLNNRYSVGSTARTPGNTAPISACGRVWWWQN
jgi:hypothetical protein